MPKNNKKPGSNRGGSEKRLKEGKPRLLYIDAPTVEVMTEAGSGNISRGIRLAAIILAYLPPQEREKLLEVARGYETQSIETIRGDRKEKS